MGSLGWVFYIKLFVTLQDLLLHSLVTSCDEHRRLYSIVSGASSGNIGIAVKKSQFTIACEEQNNFFTCPNAYLYDILSNKPN
jgi:hypothetical protein